MADIQYLNYGDQQIEQQAFLNKAANEVQAYVQNQSWSKKRKEKFMSAYSDLMNRGILGASNSTGQWMIDVGGGALPFDTMSEKDKEMYQEAAYFIQQQMQGLPTRTQEEEKKEEDKTKLPLFDNKAFTSSFINHISTSDFGGQDFHIGGENDNWNKLDARDSNGIRGKQKRTEALKNYLISYRDKFDDSKYNFEGGPFENAQDFRNRLDNAINALNTPDTNDDEQALNKLGLNPADWFNNGSGDPSGKFLNDKELTYAELAEYNQKQNELKQQQLKEQARNNFLSFGTKTSPKLVGRNPVELKTKYGDGNGLLNALYGYSQRGIKDLNADELSELQGAYRHLAKDPIDNNLLKQLQNSSSGLYRGASPNRFRKINGIDNLIWDSITGQVIQIQNRDEYEASRNQPTDLFAGVQTPQEAQKAYLNNTEFTEADGYELAGIIADIASIVDPEPISAGVLGVGAAGARNWARTRGPEKWGISDYFWQGVDYLTGVVGAVPFLGDAALAVKAVKNTAKFLKFALRIPAVYETLTSIPGAYDAANKVLHGENPTVEEWMTLGTFFRGLAANRSLNIQNRAARKALQERGYQVGNKWHQRVGLTESKPISKETPTVRMTINGEVKEIPITSELKTQLEKDLAKKGNDVESRSKVIRENSGVQKAAEDAGIRVKESNGNISDSWNKAQVIYNQSILNSRLFGGRWGLTPKYMRTSGDSFGVNKEPISRGQDKFDNYINGDRGLWDRFKYGSNRTLRGMDRYNKAIHETSSQVSTNNSQNQPSPQTSTNNSSNSPEDLRFNRGVMKRYKEHLKGNFSNRTIQEGTYKIGDTDMNVSSMVNKKNGKTIYDVHFGDRHFYNLTQDKAKQKIFSLIKESRKSIDKNQNVTKKSTKEIGKILQDLKRKGWLKEGGTIDRQKIQNYKEFINK